MAERFRGTGVILRFIEFMDVGSTNGWRLDDVVPAQEIVDRIGATWPLEPVDRVTPGDVADALALSRRRWRDRRHRVGHAAVLRRLHARPHLGRGQALHVPVRGRRPRPARAAPLRGRRRRRWTSGSAPSGRGARTATPTFAPPRPRRGRRSRCRTSAASSSAGRRSARPTRGRMSHWCQAPKRQRAGLVSYSCQAPKRHRAGPCLIGAWHQNDTAERATRRGAASRAGRARCRAGCRAATRAASRRPARRRHR